MIRAGSINQSFPLIPQGGTGKPRRFAPYRGVPVAFKLRWETTG